MYSRDLYVKIIICIVVTLTGLGMLVGSIGGMFYDDQLIPVSGTVYGMNQNVESHYKSTSVTDVYRIAVHPDDSGYNDYDVRVTFSDYCKHKVGDHVTYDVPRCTKKDFNGHYGVIITMLVLGLFFFITHGVTLIKILNEE